jgi:hypothetical protein
LIAAKNCRQQSFTTERALLTAEGYGFGAAASVGN